MKYFIVWIIFSNIISTDYVDITEKKVSCFCFWFKFFSMTRMFIFVEQHKSIVCVILTIYLHWFDSKPPLFCHCNRCCSSHNPQRATIVCFVHCIYKVIWLRRYIFLSTSFVLSIFFSNKISTSFVAITARRVNLFF